MTATLRYLVNPTPNREELDFRTTGAKYILDGKEYDYSLHGEAAETGNGLVNTVWTAPGISINAKSLLGGADVVLFEGQWSDYIKVLSPLDGTITFRRTVGDKVEQVTVANGQLTTQQDLLVFADGSVRTDTARRALDSQGLSASVDDLMKTGVATAGTADDWNASVTSSHSGALLPESPGGSIRVSASEAASFALPTVGVSQVLTGSDGVDQVYITPGAVVDARALLGGEDQIFLTDKWENYTKSLDSAAGTITLTREVGGQTETVIVGDGQLVANRDLLVFSDGAVRTDTACMALTQNLAASVADLTAQGTKTTLTADDWTNTTYTLWGAEAPVIDKVTGDDKVNAAEKHNGVLVSGRAEANSKIEVQWGQAHKSVTADAEGKWSATFASAEVLDDGTTELSVTATDSTGYVSAPATESVLVDTVAPDAALVKPIEGNGTINAQQKNDGIVIAGTAEPGSTVTVDLDGQPKTVPADENGDWQVPYFKGEIPNDGTVDVKITVTDPAGNVTSEDVQLVIDTMVAVPMINTVTVDNMVNATEKEAGVSVSGFAEAGSAVNVSWGNTEHAVKADDQGAWSSTFATADIPADGPTQISAVATDVAGNVSTKATRDVTVDTFVSAPVITSMAREYGNDDYAGYNDQYLGSWDINKDLTAKGTAEAGSLVEVKWGSATHQVLVQSDGTWATIFGFSEVPADGATVLHAVVTDSAGNISTVQRDLIVDTVGPADATIDSIAGDNVVNAKEKAAGLTVTGTAEANGYVMVTIPSLPYSVDMPFKTVAVDGAGHWSVHFNSNEVPNGSYAVWAVAFDEAYNPQFGQTFTAQNFTYDTEMATPLINTVAGDNLVNAIEKQEGVTVTGTAEAGSAVNVSWGNTEHVVKADDQGAWSSTFATVEISADGPTQISAVATDVAGNVSTKATRDVTVDTFVSAPVITSMAREYGNDDYAGYNDQYLGSWDINKDLTAKGTAEAGSLVEVKWGSATHQVLVQSDGTWATIFGFSEVPADGATVLHAVVTDSAGNISTVQRDLIVDTVGPADATIDSIAGDNVVNAKEKAAGLTVTGTAEANGYVMVTIPSLPYSVDMPFKTVAVDGAGHWSVHFNSNEVPNGSYAVWAVAFDEAYNPQFGQTFTAQNFTYDTEMATPLINTVAGDNLVNAIEKQEGVTVTGTAEAGSAVNVSWGNTEHVVKADDQGAWSSTFATVEIPADGPTQISAVATDVAGNVSVQVTRDVTVDAAVVAPVVDKVPADAGASAAAQATSDTVTGTVEARSVVSLMGSAEHTVTTGTDVVGNVSITQTRPGSVELNPVLSSDVAGASNFDVRSDIVVKSSLAGHLADGIWTIKVVNDANDATHDGYRGENQDSTQSLTFSVANGVVTDLSGGHVHMSADGKSIVLDPTFDLDLGNKYHIEAAAGMFKTDSGGVSDAFNGANFATVSPGAYNAADAHQGGVLAQKFDDSGALVDSQHWVDITGNGRFYGAQTSINAGDGDYAFVVKDLCGDAPDAGTTAAGDGVTIDGDLNVLLTNFGKDDLLYIDQQDNHAYQNDMTQSTFQAGDGHAKPLEYVGGAGGSAQDSVAKVDIQLESGLTVSEFSLNKVASDIHSNTGVVISG
ncbi:hypothetical protein J3D48_006166 [Pseudomonas fluorescens]|uniref:Ig-like domain-containing protein n=1 Tax=Pseudomonas fluorescens TaxID=294 RepID=UPI00209DD37B|nr:Ig-like domain-containing protein [Pseudomonas fluorescens]MCP1489756.1 hypothetical protein [Pseudomonas fluorescens]